MSEQALASIGRMVEPRLMSRIRFLPAALARALSRGRFLLYPQDGHFMFVEEPQRFARDVAAFFRR